MVSQEKDVAEGKALQMEIVCQLVILPHAKDYQEPLELEEAKRPSSRVFRGYGDQSHPNLRPLDPRTRRKIHRQS